MTLMPWPTHDRLARDTDLFIRQLAEAADAGLSSVVKLFTGGGPVTTDANGDVIVDFHVPETLTGCLIVACTDTQYENQLRVIVGPVAQYPQPPAGYPIRANPVQIFPREFVPAQGKVWCRVTTSVAKGPAAAHFMGAQPAAAGNGLQWRGIAWAGTSR